VEDSVAGQCDKNANVTTPPTHRICP
jgi:hypothetical protein